MLVQVRNRCSDFDSYRAARVKSLFNAESGANFSLDAELPIEEPTRYVLAINMKTARALGLQVPPSVLLRAERVVE